MRILPQKPLAACIIFALVISCSTLPKREIILVKDGNIPPIVADLGPYQTAEDAVVAAREIDWFDHNYQDDTICTTALAAIELRNYLCAILGKNEKDIPILDDDSSFDSLAICVGETPSNLSYSHFSRQIKKRWKKNKSRHPEGFRVDTFADDEFEMVLLSGRTRVGTLYAVYDFLEHLGVRWYGPGEQGQFVPQYTDIVMPPTARYDEPAMEIRGFWIEPGQVKGGLSAWIGKPYNRGNPDFYTWMGRNRMNYFWNKETDWTALKLRGIQLNCGGHDYYRLLLNPETPYPYDHPNFKGDEDKPADPYPVGDEYVGDTDGNGVLNYYEAHLEWYGLNEQGRRFFPTGRTGVNFCTSNEYGCAEFCKNVVKELKDGDWHNADIYDFWPLDAGNWCRCENCQALGNDTDKILDMLYKIRKAVRTAYENGELNRDVKVFTLAYRQTWSPPSKPLPKDFDYDNTAVVFFPIDRCFNHPFADPKCTEVNKPLRSYLESWFDPQCPYKGKIYIGEYYNISGFRDLPLIFMHIIARDIPYYSSIGVKGLHYMHTATSDLGIRVLLNYQFAKQLWNPFINTDSLLNDFFDNYYLGVSSEMCRFYFKMEEAMANVKAWRYELRHRMERIASGNLKQPLLPLEKFRDHFCIEEYSPNMNDGVDWERTYQLIHEARFALDDAIRSEVDDIVLNRLVEDERHFRYGELTVHLYDNVIRLFTLDQDEPEMRDEALIRLKQNARELARFEIRSPALGVSNGLEASGLKKVVDFLLQQNRLLKSTI